MMEHTATPSLAYDLLEPFERQAVDNYVEYVIGEQKRNNQLIRYALSMPIPSEYVRRSKGVLAKPLARAAVADRINRAANEEDTSPDRVIQEHEVIAFSNIADYMMVKEFGDFSVKPLDQIPRHLMAAVKSLKSIPSPYGIRTEITLFDKLPSLKLMGELMGLVAPDAPPVLKKYVTPPATVEQLSQVPETAYAKLLELSAAR